MSPVRLDWERHPVSIHHEDKQVIDDLLSWLKERHDLTKRSITMVDRENGGHVAFLYAPCDPRWIIEWEQQRTGGDD